VDAEGAPFGVVLTVALDPVANRRRRVVAGWCGRPAQPANIGACRCLRRRGSSARPSPASSVDPILMGCGLHQGHGSQAAARRGAVDACVMALCSCRTGLRPSELGRLAGLPDQPGPDGSRGPRWPTVLVLAMESVG